MIERKEDRYQTHEALSKNRTKHNNEENNKKTPSKQPTHLTHRQPEGYPLNGPSRHHLDLWIFSGRWGVYFVVLIKTCAQNT